MINQGPELLISHPLNQNKANDHFFFFESEDLKLGCIEKANNKNHTNLHNTQGTHTVWPKLIQITQGLAEEGSLLAESF